MSSDALYLKRLRLLPQLPAGSFVRPADTAAYGAGDLIANSVTAGSVAALEIAVPGGGGQVVMLRRMKLLKSGTSVTNAAFRVHWFTAAPTVANGDNGVLSMSTGAAAYVCSMSVGAVRAFGDGVVAVGVPDMGSDVAAVLGASGKLYALIEALAAYTPGSAETFNVTLELAVA